MVKYVLEDFVPVSKEGTMQFDWTVEYEKGKFFKAFCCSRDKRTVCTYVLTSTTEKLTVETTHAYGIKPPKTVVDRETPLSKRIKPLNNNGDGIVSLSGGYVARRFGYFRAKEFQDFLDRHGITGVKNFEDYGFNTTFIIEQNNIKRNKLVFPRDTSVYIINRNTNFRSKDRCLIIEPSGDDFKIVNVHESPFWLYDEWTPKGHTRKLYIHGSRVNAMQFDEELAKISK